MKKSLKIKFLIDKSLILKLQLPCPQRKIHGCGKIFDHYLWMPIFVTEQESFFLPS